MVTYITSMKMEASEKWWLPRQTDTEGEREKEGERGKCQWFAIKQNDNRESKEAGTV